MTETPETITRDELAEALRGLKTTPEDENTFYPAVADAIFEKAKRNREPEYEPGGIYQDPEGNPWQFVRTGGTGEPYWVRPGTVSTFAIDIPRRPLRKLVPEGPRPDHAAVLAEIVAWARESNQYKVLADRICKLIGVSDEL